MSVGVWAEATATAKAGRATRGVNESGGVNEGGRANESDGDDKAASNNHSPTFEYDHRRDAKARRCVAKSVQAQKGTA